MDAAKSAVKDFTSKHGHHDTTVHEHMHPAITHEHITPTRHEHATTAIDREIHQEHHHTSVQPLRHREVLPEKHHHNLIPVEHREHHHGDSKAITERVGHEHAQFKDVSETGEVQHSHSVLPVVAGEHIHHHVHEYIQPIIQKETIQPTVVHTTIPIHEVHHREAKHHAASALPAISLADWKKQGGTLTGRGVRSDHFKGEPHNETAEQHARHGGMHLHGLGPAADSAESTGGHHRNVLHKHDTRHETGRDAGLAGAGAAAGATAADHHHHHQQARSSHDGAPIAATAPESPNSTRTDPRIDSVSSAASGHSRALSRGSHSTARTSLSHGAEPADVKPDTARFADTHAGSAMDSAQPATATADPAARRTFAKKDTPVDARKPSLLKRLNPLKDADGDGRKGIMS